MGLRTPQELLRNKPNTPTPTGKFSAGKGSQIGTEFIGTISKAAAAKQQSQEDFVDAVTRNKLKTFQTEAKAKLSGLKGLDAIEQDQAIRTEYETQVKQVMSEAPSFYRDSVRGQKAQLEHTGDYNRFSIAYSAGEGRKIQDEAYKTNMANNMNDMVERSSDVDYIVGEGLNVVENSILKNAQRTYGTDRSVKLASGITAGEMMDAEVEAGVSEAVRKSVQMQIAADRYDLVDDTVTRLADRITPDDRVKIAKMVETGKAKQEDTRSLAIATQAYQTSDGDLQQAEKFIRAASGTDAKLYAKSLQMVKTRSQIDEDAKDKREDDAYNQGYDDIMKTGQVSSPVRNILPPKKLNELISNASKNRGKPAVVTDWETFDKAKRDMDRMTDEDIAKLNLQKMYQHSVNVEDIKTLEKRQEVSKTRIDKGFASGGKYKTAVPDRITKIFAKDLKYREKTAEYSKLQRLITDAYSDILIENPKITDQDVDRKLIRIVSDSIKTETVEGSYWWSDDKTTIGLPKDIDSLRNSGKSGLTPSEVGKLQAKRLRDELPPYTEDQLIRFAQGRTGN